ncbi:MAG TPA: Ku protein, partial [Gemmataceae bacterium]|nr:Ku protein [Gemmataceae bacterium]
MSRSSWDGFLRLSLISIPVRAFNSAEPNHGAVRFNQIHKNCGERIRYKKTCPIHGEVDKDEVVSGYPVDKNEYAEVSRDEIAKLKSEDDKAIEIDAFTSPDAIGPEYFSGKTFYLLPDGPAGQKPYALLCRVMAEKGVQAIAHMVLSGHEQQVVIRPAQPEGKVLEMSVLFYASQVKPIGSFGEEVEGRPVSAQELKLASALVDQSIVKKFDFSKLADHYAERVTQLVESKAAGKTVTTPKKESPARVINLMDALKKSLRKGPNLPKAPKKPPRS